MISILGSYQKLKLIITLKAEADAQATTTSGDSNDLRAANQRIAELEKSLEKSRREIEKINRNWEKRFRILRTSMHEIKNESFVRRRLEYQPMALHTAKMNYRAGLTLSSCPYKTKPLHLVIIYLETSVPVLKHQ